MAPSWPTFLRRCKAKERFDLKSTPPTLLAPVAGGWHPFFISVRILWTFCVSLVDVTNILTDYFSFSSSFSSFFSLLRTLHPIGIDVRVPMTPNAESKGKAQMDQAGT